MAFDAAQDLIEGGRGQLAGEGVLNNSALFSGL
jgi:hypothetical protein